MKVLNFGSLNLDLVYAIHHIVKAGETFAADRMDKFPGGKGLNQSVALAKAGAPVLHAGNIGTDGKLLEETLSAAGVDTGFIRITDVPTGHAIIQVDRAGENSIILYPGANHCVTSKQIDEVLAGFEAGDYLILQNEINLVGEMIEKAFRKGMNIVLNPSPMDEKILQLPLDKVTYFLLNEVEGAAITGEPQPEKILDSLKMRFPQAKIVLTLGGSGSVYMDNKEKIFQNIYRVNVVDTTAAGDTFTGFFIGSLLRGQTPAQALDIAARASAIAVSRKGASPSVPTWDEVMSTQLELRLS